MRSKGKRKETTVSRALRMLKEDSALRAGRGKFHWRPGKPGNCYKCGKSGHFARNCHTQLVQGDHAVEQNN